MLVGITMIVVAGAWLVVRDSGDGAAEAIGDAPDFSTTPRAVNASPPHRPPARSEAGQRARRQRYAPQPRPLDIEGRDGTFPVIWVRHGQRVEIRTEPGGGVDVATVGRRTEFGSPTVFGVTAQRGRWAAITTAKLPNGEVGWIRLDPRRLRVGRTRLSIHVDLSERRVVVRKLDRTVGAFTVTVGAPGSETPTGRFAVTDTLRGDLKPVYGCCAVAVSATQPNVPPEWPGGNRIAIHGTEGPLGVAASHGCVRAANRDLSALVDRIPLGTPVFIRG